MHTIRRFILFVICNLMLLTLALPAWAGEDPLRLAFINASQKGGGDAYDTLLEFLEASDDIKVKDSDKIWDAAESEGVSRKDFRNSKRRASSDREFRRVMKSLNIEAIMILDVFSKGKKLQLVVIGPSGKEVADVRKNIKRGKVSKGDAKKILKEAFGELVPNVREFRDNGGWDAVDDSDKVAQKDVEEEEEEEEEEVDEEEVDSEDDAGSLKAKAVANQSGDYGLEPGFGLRFGALVGSRSFSMSSENDFTLDHKSPFVGVAARVDGVLAVFSEGSAAMGFAVFGGYAPFTTIFDKTEEYPSAYGRLGAELVFTKAFSPEMSLDIFGGAEAWSITIEKNKDYTGNRYISGRVGGKINYSAGPVILHAGAGVLPAFDIDNSSGAFGPSDLTIGLEGLAGLTFGLTDAIELMIGYNFTSISPEYPEPVVRSRTGEIGATSSSDVYHVGALTIGYSL